MQLQINEKRRELKSHGSFHFPVFVSYEQLSNYERGAFSCHWHPEIELTLFLEGEMIYQVNDQVYHLHAGQGLFCNSNALHSGHMTETGGDCRYLSITFHPRIVYGFENSLIQKEFVSPILQDTSFGSAAFSRDTQEEEKILSALSEIEAVFGKRETIYPMQIQQLLTYIWQILYTACYTNTERSKAGADGRDVERIRQALDYIHSHYSEPVTLQQIAEQMHLCRSESCRFFKKYMRQPIFEYLQNYRIQKSLELLAQTDEAVTEVAMRCGFSGSAYFSKVFREQMRCTPMAYRKTSRVKSFLPPTL